MKVVVFTGGTASNSLVNCFEALSHDVVKTPNGPAGNSVTHIIPVSDNGGSTSEILRCFGGIALGDLRNRALRLFQDEPLRQFLHHRFDKDSTVALQEWESLIRGDHHLWAELLQEGTVSQRLKLYPMFRELFLKFAAKVEQLDSKFDFSAASVGNILLKSMEMQSGIDAALEQFLQFGGVPPNFSIVPCVIISEHMAGERRPEEYPLPTLQLQLVLANGDVITGQSEISHPADLSSNNTSQLHFSKSNDAHPQLAAAVQQLRYVLDDSGSISPIWPRADPAALQAIESADYIIYSIGSLITSLMPSLIVPEIACAIAKNIHAKKVLLQNGTYDRESYGLDSVSYTMLVNDTLRQAALSCSEDAIPSANSWVDHVIRLQDSEIQIPSKAEPWYSTVTIPSSGSGSGSHFDPDILLETLRSL